MGLSGTTFSSSSLTQGEAKEREAKRRCASNETRAASQGEINQGNIVIFPSVAPPNWTTVPAGYSSSVAESGETLGRSSPSECGASAWPWLVEASSLCEQRESVKFEVRFEGMAE